jgi:hypothetical protein
MDESKKTTELTFEPFEKLGRMNRRCTITEKIDGTNAQILFGEDGEMLVGSRKREIWPEGYEGKPKGCDNAGFAKWAYENRDALFEFLGQGRHFGEWCGGKIQRGYGTKGKSFLLFNVKRFGRGRQEIPRGLADVGLGVVPTLYEGDFSTDVVSEVMRNLLETGSHFVEGFMNPEGVVVYHNAIRKMFKVTYEHDMTGKGKNRQTDVIKED